jgi:2,3-bisphosphoglycerate-independent phosphoglycerate mutase
MWDYSSGHITTDEGQQLIGALNESLGSDQVHFYPGVSYRHICKFRGREDTLLATCTPPHDIPDKPIDEFMPGGSGSDLLRDLMQRSEVILREHPVNVERRARGDIPASMLWLFWGSGRVPDMPPFQQIYGLEAAVTSAVDVIRGLAGMMGMGILEIPGVKDGLDNDFTAQAVGALAVLSQYDLAVIHVEATDEAGHTGSIDDKIEAIQRVDKEVVSRLRSWRPNGLRVLILPDHPTPIKTRTHSSDPVPFMLWGAGFTSNGAKRFTEAEAAKTGLFINPGYNIMDRLVGRG